MKKVVIKVENGIIEILECPADVELFVLDFDTQVWDEEKDSAVINVDHFTGEVVPSDGEQKLIADCITESRKLLKIES